MRPLGWLLTRDTRAEANARGWTVLLVQKMWANARGQQGSQEQPCDERILHVARRLLIEVTPLGNAPCTTEDWLKSVSLDVSSLLKSP